MEYYSEIISQLINNYDFAFMITANVLTYTIIKILEWLNKTCGEWQKRIVLGIVIITLSIIYYFVGDLSYTTLINSAIAAPVFYSWIMKPILKKFGLGYENIIN